MLINAPQCTSSVVRLGAFFVFLLTCGIYLSPPRIERVPASIQVSGSRIKNITETSSTFNASVIEFWQDLASALVAAAPQCEPLQIQDEHVATRFDPLNGDKKGSQRLVNFTDQDETALLRAHYQMRKSAQRLAPKLAYSEGTTGIVVTANAEQLPVLLVSVHMLRRTGCSIPMEVFLDGWAVYDKTTCEIVLPSLNARCVILPSIYNQSAAAKKPIHSQYPILAVLFSTFQHVLFLDADAFPVYDPTVLFTTPPYTTHGLVLWPSPYALTTSAHYYHIAGIPPEPISTRPSSDSGQIMLNKSLHRISLLMMVYYTYHGPSHYYPLLASPSGPADIPLLAALATSLPYYQVRTAPRLLGRWWNGTFRATGLAQADCGTDFEYLAPFPSHAHPSPTWSYSDLAHLNATTLHFSDPAPSNATKPLDKKLNMTRHAPPPRPKPVFVHQNVLKMHPGKLLRDKAEITYEPHDGTRHRMWGLKEHMEKVLGFDLERRLWFVVAEEACRESEGADKCRRVREYVGEVFGWMESIDRPW